MAKTILHLQHNNEIFQVKEVIQDELNFFRAITKALGTEEREEKDHADLLRTRTCALINREIKHYEEFFRQSITAEYIKTSLQNINKLIIQAMADALQMDIVIIEPLNPVPFNETSSIQNLIGTQQAHRYYHDSNLAQDYRSYIFSMPLTLHSNNQLLSCGKNIYSYVHNADNLECLAPGDLLEGILADAIFNENSQNTVSPIDAPDLSNFDTSPSAQETNESQLEIPAALLHHLSVEPIEPRPPQLSPALANSPALLKLMHDIGQLAQTVQIEPMPVAAQTVQIAPIPVAAPSFPIDPFAGFDSDFQSDQPEQEQESESESESEQEDGFVEFLDTIPSCEIIKQNFKKKSLGYWCLNTLFSINPTLATIDTNLQALLVTSNIYPITSALLQIKVYKAEILTQELFQKILEAGDCAAVFIEAFILLCKNGKELTYKLIERLIEEKDNATKFVKLFIGISKSDCHAQVGTVGNTPILGITQPYHKTGEFHNQPLQACKFRPGYVNNPRVWRLVTAGILLPENVRSIPPASSSSDSYGSLSSESIDSLLPHASISKLAN